MRPRSWWPSSSSARDRPGRGPRVVVAVARTPGSGRHAAPRSETTKAVSPAGRWFRRWWTRPDGARIVMRTVNAYDASRPDRDGPRHLRVVRRGRARRDRAERLGASILGTGADQRCARGGRLRRHLRQRRRRVAAEVPGRARPPESQGPVSRGPAALPRPRWARGRGSPSRRRGLSVAPERREVVRAARGDEGHGTEREDVVRPGGARDPRPRRARPIRRRRLRAARPRRRARPSAPADRCRRALRARRWVAPESARLALSKRARMPSPVVLTSVPPVTSKQRARISSCRSSRPRHVASPMSSPVAWNRPGP